MQRVLSVGSWALRLQHLPNPLLCSSASGPAPSTPHPPSPRLVKNMRRLHRVRLDKEQSLWQSCFALPVSSGSKAQAGFCSMRTVLGQLSVAQDGSSVLGPPWCEAADGAPWAPLPGRVMGFPLTMSLREPGFLKVHIYRLKNNQCINRNTH